MEEKFICLRMIISVLDEGFSFCWIFSYVSIQTQIIINLFVTKMQEFKKCHMHSLPQELLKNVDFASTKNLCLATLILLKKKLFHINLTRKIIRTYTIFSFLSSAFLLFSVRAVWEMKDQNWSNLVRVVLLSELSN